MNRLDRIGRFVACGAAAAAIGLSGAPAAAQAPALPAPVKTAVDPGALDGVWIISGYKGSQGSTARQRVQTTVDGKVPPLQPWALQLLGKRIKDSDDGNPFANTVTNCLPGGVPAMMFGGPTPIQIIPTARQVTIIFEELNHFRTIRLTGGHIKDADPGYMGDSIGHWEGDTLVVDTVGLTENTTIDGVGMPHSEDMHVVERFRRTGNDTMEILVTIDDPKTFTAPWTARAVYKFVPQMKVNEYICENNRNGSDGPGGITGFQPPSRR